MIDVNSYFKTFYRYPEQYDKTSSRYFRHPLDMQFSFGYFYFLMNEEVDVPVSQIFDLFDTDQSG